MRCHDGDAALAQILRRDGLLSEERLRQSLAEVGRRRRQGLSATLASVLRTAEALPEEQLGRAEAEARAACSMPAAAPRTARPSARTPTWVESESAAGGAAGGEVTAQLALTGGQLRPGQRLGPYTVRRVIGRGGMGTVYEVTTSGGARFALKTLALADAALDDELLHRFRREGEYLARLDHPHVVRVHSARFDGPVPYLVQDLLPGPSLEERLRKGPLPVDTAARLACALGSAVAHAHEHGVLHRDLKPENVLFDDRGEPRLVDFGLGLALGSERERLSRTGAVLGTPGYLSPEQALGLKAVDERADVYGLGALLFAALAGRPPFAGRGALATLEAVVNAPPPDPCALRPEVPPALGAVVLRALAKDPSERLPSARAFVDAVRCAAQSGAHRPVRRVRRPEFLFGGLALSGLVAGGLAFALGRGPKAPAPTRPAPGTEAAQPLPKREPPPPERGSGTSRGDASPAQGAGWALAPGDSWRGRFWRTTDYQPPGDAPPQRRGAWKSDHRFVVLELRPDGARLEATIERLMVDFAFGLARVGPRLRYDGWHPDAPDQLSALGGIQGQAVELLLDPRRGAVLSCRGVERLRDERVLPALPPERVGGGQTAKLVAQGFTDEALRRDLDFVLHCVPPAGARPGSRWTETLRTPFLGLDLPVELRFELRRGRVLVEGAAARPLPPWARRYELQGSARLEEGRPVRVRYQERAWLPRLGGSLVGEVGYEELEARGH